MDEDHEKVADVRDQITQGEYHVDPEAVADAILRRLRELAAARREQVGAHERAWAKEH
jgi:Anti-sigma-28 factor, FlgM